MFFSIVNLIIDKYYPNLMTQIIIGCICYAFSFFILNEFISEALYDKYQYYIVALFTIDASYLIYKKKYTPQYTIPKPEPIIEKEKSVTDISTNNSETLDNSELFTSIKLSSEHSVKQTSDTENSIFLSETSS